MAERRRGLPNVYVTWLAKLLAGQQCQWRVWFQSHYWYDKYEPEKFDLVKWNQDHNALMRARRRELEAAGYTVTVEGQNGFKFQGKAAVLDGKPDIIASNAHETIIVDGKTGRERESDIWQVLLYLFAVPACRPELVRGALSGEVQYKQGDQRITLPVDALTPDREQEIVSLIRVVAADTPPRKVPSYDECKRCNIGVADCPQRVMEQPGVAKAAGF